MLVSKTVVYSFLAIPLVVTLIVRLTGSDKFQRIFHSLFPIICGLVCLTYPIITTYLLPPTQFSSGIEHGLFIISRLFFTSIHFMVIVPAYVVIVYCYTRIILKEDLDAKPRNRITDAERDRW